MDELVETSRHLDRDANYIITTLGKYFLSTTPHSTSLWSYPRLLATHLSWKPSGKSSIIAVDRYTVGESRYYWISDVVTPERYILSRLARIWKTLN
jgi:hypothetical protein